MRQGCPGVVSWCQRAEALPQRVAAVAHAADVDKGHGEAQVVGGVKGPFDEVLRGREPDGAPLFPAVLRPSDPQLVEFQF